MPSRTLPPRATCVIAEEDTEKVRQVPRLECWLVTAQTVAGSDDRRRATARAYTAYLEQHLKSIALGAQVLDRPGGEVVRRMYFVHTDDASLARIRSGRGVLLAWLTI